MASRKRKTTRRRPVRRKKSFFSGITGQIIAILVFLILTPLAISAAAGYNERYTSYEALERTPVKPVYKINNTTGYAKEITSSGAALVTPIGTLYTISADVTALYVALNMTDGDLNNATYVKIVLKNTTVTEVSLYAIDGSDSFKLSTISTNKNGTYYLKYDALDYAHAMATLGDVDYCELRFTVKGPATENITIGLVKPDGFIVKHSSLINTVLYASGIFFIFVAVASTKEFNPTKGLL